MPTFEVHDADLRTALLKDGDIVSCDAELINFDWLKILNNGVRPVVFIAVAGRTGGPKTGCLHPVSIQELKQILTQIEANIEAAKKHA